MKILSWENGGLQQDQRKPVIRIKTSLIRFINDIIHQFMNRFKMHKTGGKNGRNITTYHLKHYESNQTNRKIVLQYKK
jgi:hypothetical protein